MTTLNRTLYPVTLALACLAFAPAEARPPAGGTLSGTVVETTNASRYTYIRIDTGTTNLWAAGPTTDVKVGDKVALTGAFQMTSFRSQSLNRTFDRLYFASGIVPAGAAETNRAVQLSPGHPAIDGKALPPGHPAVDRRGACPESTGGSGAADACPKTEGAAGKGCCPGQSGSTRP